MHQSSPAQQTVVATPGWTTINNIRPAVLPPPPPTTQPQYHHPSSLLVAPPPSSWNYNHNNNIDLSCSQLLLGGFVGEANKPAGLRALENWEQHLLNLISNDLMIPTPAADEFQTPNNGNTSSPSSCNNWANQVSSPSSCVTTLNIPKKHPHQRQECNSNSNSNGNGNIGTKIGGAAKKARIQPPAPHSTFKVRKEKLGDRITALHQLVSPFGKTDTASVLLEAIGYIRFLQSQIEALSLPYLSNKSTSQTGCDEETNNKLRSRGLCLVPVSCTLQVESENGADYWAPAFDASFR